MDHSELKRWAKVLQSSERRPAYLMIADLIADDIDSGRLRARDKLPPLRDLAAAVGINYTTAARAYSEAKQRGLIESSPGSGSFVKGKTPNLGPVQGSYEMTMNLIIEPGVPALMEDLKQKASDTFKQRDLFSLLRYQSFGGMEQDRLAAQHWLSKRLSTVQQDQILICPGIHSALLGLMNLLITSGKFLCVESLAYPGIKAIAAQLGIAIYALERDMLGPLPRAFENACKKGNIGALYINPTIHNPTTTTIPKNRRERLADIALRYSVPIIEDDAYAMLNEELVTPFADMAPELTYYITGMSKCFGPGLRSAFLHAPSKRKTQRISAAMRALTVMSSPFTDALVTTFIKEGIAESMLKAVREESHYRQKLVGKHLQPAQYKTAAGAFHLWLNLPKDSNVNPSELAVELRNLGVSVVSSATFSTDNNPPDALRVCFGGPISRDDWEDNLQHIVEALEKPSLVLSAAH